MHTCELSRWSPANALIAFRFSNVCFCIDFVSNLTVARQGYPQMAVGACYGSPLLNILIGIGISCSVACITKANPFPIQFEKSLAVSSTFLLIALVSSAAFVPLNKFQSHRRYGFYLVGLYVACTATSLAVTFS